jgi:replicative DNA helicase
MSIAEKTFLGSLMKAEYLLKDTVIQPEYLDETDPVKLVVVAQIEE